MFFYSFYTFTIVAALLVTCHALCKCPESSGLLKILGMAGKDNLKEQQQRLGLVGPSGNNAFLWPQVLPCSLDNKMHNVFGNVEYRLSRLEGVLALNGKIKEVGDKLFTSNGKEVNFASALESCEKAGGTLATPTSEEENEAVLGFVKQFNRYAYLGIKESENVGQFKTINETPLNYTNWRKGEPNGKGTEKCVEMFTDGTWNDKKCNQNRLTICEF